MLSIGPISGTPVSGLLVSRRGNIYSIVIVRFRLPIQDQKVSTWGMSRIWFEGMPITQVRTDGLVIQKVVEMFMATEGKVLVESSVVEQTAKGWVIQPLDSDCYRVSVIHPDVFLVGAGSVSVTAGSDGFFDGGIVQELLQ